MKVGDVLAKLENFFQQDIAKTQVGKKIDDACKTLVGYLEEKKVISKVDQFTASVNEQEKRIITNFLDFTWVVSVDTLRSLKKQIIALEAKLTDQPIPSEKEAKKIHRDFSQMNTIAKLVSQLLKQIGGKREGKVTVAEVNDLAKEIEAVDKASTTTVEEDQFFDPEFEPEEDENKPV